MSLPGAPRPRSLALLALGLFGLSACGARYGQRVPDDVVEKLPYEARIELLEAENELAISVDRADEAQNEVSRTREALRRAKSRLDAAEEEVDEAPDATSKDVAELAVKEAEARVTFLRARQKLNAANRELEALALRCAFARFERSRLEAARKAKVEGSESLEVAEYEAQVTDCEAEVAEEKAELAEEQAELAAAKQAWDEQRSELAKKTFDARASPFVE